MKHPKDTTQYNNTEITMTIIIAQCTYQQYKIHNEKNLNFTSINQQYVKSEENQMPFICKKETEQEKL